MHVQSLCALFVRLGAPGNIGRKITYNESQKLYHVRQQMDSERYTYVRREITTGIKSTCSKYNPNMEVVNGRRNMNMTWQSEWKARER